MLVTKIGNIFAILSPKSVLCHHASFRFCWILLILGPKLNNFEENLTRAKPKAVNRSASRARSSRTTSTVRIGTRVDDFI